jgi:hypothetical protein
MTWSALAIIVFRVGAQAFAGDQSQMRLNVPQFTTRIDQVLHRGP